MADAPTIIMQVFTDHKCLSGWAPAFPLEKTNEAFKWIELILGKITPDAWLAWIRTASPQNADVARQIVEVCFGISG
jgi:hypothetical protein